MHTIRQNSKRVANEQWEVGVLENSHSPGIRPQWCPIPGMSYQLPQQAANVASFLNGGTPCDVLTGKLDAVPFYEEEI